MTRTMIPSCFQCGKDLEPRLAPPQHMTMRYEGSPHEVLVDKLPEWHCADCKVSVVDESSDKPLQDALRKHIGLLRPEQIKAGLKALGISQDKFAERLGCAAESVSRWLNGVVLQSRTYDRLMRIYFHVPVVRGLLENFSPDSSFGEKVVHADAAGGAASGFGSLPTPRAHVPWGHVFRSVTAAHAEARWFSEADAEASDPGTGWVPADFGGAAA